jgi:hypothetical protein
MNNIVSCVGLTASLLKWLTLIYDETQRSQQDNEKSSGFNQSGMRDAIQLLEQLATSKISEIRTEDVQAATGGISSEKLVLITYSVLNGEIHQLMKLSQEFADEGVQPAKLLRELLAIYRDLLLLQRVHPKFAKIPECDRVKPQGLPSGAAQLPPVPSLGHSLTISIVMRSSRSASRSTFAITKLPCIAE